MAAPAGVNEESPQEPMNPVLTHVEPMAVELLAAEPVEAEVAGGGSAEGGAAEPESAEAESAEVQPSGTEPSGTELAGTELAGTEPTRDVSPLAIIGVILGVIALVGLAAGVLAVATHGFHRKTVVTYRPAAVFRLRPGDCINSGANDLAFTLLACSTPHDAEVFATFALPGSSWPGNTAVQQDAGNGCANRIGGYLNPQLANAALAQEYIYPDQAAWQVGQRTVVCEIRSSSGQLTGSVRKAS